MHGYDLIDGLLSNPEPDECVASAAPGANGCVKAFCASTMETVGCALGLHGKSQARL